MKIYRLQAIGDFEGTSTLAIWFTRKSDAPRLRRELLDLDQDPAFDTVLDALQVYEVPTDKRGLVDFLNMYCDGGASGWGGD
jgi:uncharacterized membrane protein YheB (UPF0754 family)